MNDLRTLIVEESPVLRRTLSSALEDLAPIQVVAGVANHELGIQLLSLSAYDLIIIDVSGDGGVAGLRELIRQNKARYTIALTANITPAIQRACVNEGAAAAFDRADLDGLVACCERLRRADLSH